MKCVLNFSVSYGRDFVPIKIKFLEQNFNSLANVSYALQGRPDYSVCE